METIWMLLLYLAAGYVAQRFLPEAQRVQWANRLNRFVIYLSLPSLVFVYMIDLNVDARFILPIASAWGLFGVSVAAILLLSWQFGWSRGLTGTLLMSIPYGNTSFLGIPFTQAFFGETGVPYAIVYDQLGSFLILSTAGIITLSLYSAEQATPLRIIRRIVTFPAFIALVLSLSLDPALPPSWLMEGLTLLAATLTPVALLAIGLHLRLKLEPGNLIPLSCGLAIKLILAPLVLLILFQGFQIEGLAAQVSVFEAGMGPMISSTMLAIMAGLQPRFAASVLGYGIILSFATLPILFALI
jgi:predicted permease